ncbi:MULTISPECIES: hypothetical protein [unclassified Streptomyces]|uniref:hypothetical protein n=1 Tax=unclassified Streptomyces TaxID=2593676 RepID=UPI003680CEFD
MKIIDLGPGDPRLESDLLPVLTELRPHLTPELFREVYALGHPQGLRFSAAYADDGRCVGAAGGSSTTPARSASSTSTTW